MPDEPQQLPVFRIDIDETMDETSEASTPTSETNELLQQLLLGQERQNELLEDLVENLSASQRQRANELVQWKQSNPELAQKCHEAAESLSRVQTEFLETLTEEINDNFEGYVDGDFLLNEFVDRYGPRLAHLNGVLQVLAQLSSLPSSH